VKPDAPFREYHRGGTGGTAAGEFAISPELDETRAFTMSFRLDNAEIQVLENTDTREPN